MVEIIRSVTSPMALTALALLLGAGILRIILRGKTTKNSKIILHYGFGLAIGLSVLANLSAVLDKYLLREIRVSGTVVDENGTGLKGAVVLIAGKGRDVTDETGAFEFIVPDVWAADSYHVDVSLAGFEPRTATLQGRSPEPLTITLKKKGLTSDRIVSIDPSIQVAHYLGIPSIIVEVTYTNPRAEKLLLDGLNFELEAAGGKRIPMTKEAQYIPGAHMPLQALPMVDVPAHGSTRYGYILFNGNQEYLTLGMSINGELQQKGITNPGFPDPDRVLLSNGLVDRLQRFMEHEFIWTAGAWKLHVSFTSGGEHFTRTVHFDLSLDDVDGMRNIAKHYASGIGAINHPSWKAWTSGDVRPIVTVKASNE